MADLTQTAAKDTSSQPIWDFLAQNGPASPDKAIEFGLELATAMERYPQGLGQLTPEMITFRQNAVFISEAESNSPLLLAPEMLDKDDRKDDNIDKQLADVWSIGVVLYTMLAGHGPFGGITRRQQIKAIITSGPTPDIRNARPDVGEDLAGLLYHMLQRNVERRSNVPNAETVRRTLERIQTRQSIPYSIPEFPIVEAKAILKDAHERFHTGKGGLNENEYQFVRRLVDTGELTIGGEYASLWRYSQRRALARRLFARVLFSYLLGLSVPVFNFAFDFLLSSTPLPALISQTIGTIIFVVIVNSVSIGIVTYTAHLSKSARPPWWALPASLGVFAGLVLVAGHYAGITTLYENDIEAFVVGAVAGLAVGGLYTLSMPGERQDTILKQSMRSVVISGVVGVAYGIYFLLTQMPQTADSSLLYYHVVASIFAVPYTIVCLLLSFVLGVELGDRYIER